MSIHHRTRIGVALLATAIAGIIPLLRAHAASADLFAPHGFAVSETSGQAGSHPDVSATVRIAADSNGVVSEHPKDLVSDLPAGFAGEPAGIPGCPLSTFSSNISFGNEQCPAGTQVGTATVTLAFGGGFTFTVQAPMYNIVPDPGQTAKFAFSVAGQYGIQLVASTRPSDYGVRITAHNISSLVDIDAMTVTFWGVPADPSHDPQRGAWCAGTSCFNGGLPAGVNRTPLLANPTRCGVGLAAIVHADSWEHRARLLSDGSPDLSDPAWQTAHSDLPAITGCDRLSFQPTISVQPTDTQAGAPTGLVVDLSVPQNPDPSGLATAELRNTVVTLPAGMVLSPSAADGLAACSNAQLGLGASSPPVCPPASKIGTATLTTPALPDRLHGDVYLAGPDTGPITKPPYRMFLTLAGDGVLIKLAGTVTPDPLTGQLTASFEHAPQQPFSDLRLELKGGPRAPLANPRTCGTFTATSELTPWSAPGSGPAATPSDSFTIGGCGDPGQFAPSLRAGSTNPVAGAYSPFVLSFSRTDADQQLSGLEATLPAGLLAKLAGVPLCDGASASAGSCPAGSRVGGVQVASGPGSHPFVLSGSVYLTGPYEGAPYGLVVVVPALAGPFDLGTVVVRQALFIDPSDAHVTVRSDPFPTILRGIPLQLRQVIVTLDRPSFVVNPTSCDPMSIGASLQSTGGASASASSRFQIGDCANLGFTPSLRLTLAGKGRTRSGAHPELTAALSQPPGQANLRSARVALPLSLALDPNNSQHVCPYPVAQAIHGGAVGCPASTIVGTATAQTPLLDRPLSGNVYLVQGIRFGPQHQQIRTLPTLLVPLRGQIALDLRAQTSVDGTERLVTTFGAIPDAPVSSFTLTIAGGRNGLLVITGRGRSICNARQTAHADLGAQSGAVSRSLVRIATPCARPRHHARRHRHGRPRRGGRGARR